MLITVSLLPLNIHMEANGGWNGVSRQKNVSVNGTGVLCLSALYTSPSAFSFQSNHLIIVSNVDNCMFASATYTRPLSLSLALTSPIVPLSPLLNHTDFQASLMISTLYLSPFSQHVHCFRRSSLTLFPPKGESRGRR